MIYSIDSIKDSFKLRRMREKMKIHQQKKFNQIGKDEEKKNQESFHQRKNVQ